MQRVRPLRRRDPNPAGLIGVGDSNGGLIDMDIVWAEEDLANWRTRLVNADGTNTGELQIVDGRGRGAHTAGLATTYSNLRQIYTRRGTNFGDAAEIRGLWYGPNKFSSVSRPQMGFVLGAAQRGAKWSACVAWYDIVFASPSIINVGVWQWDGVALELRAANVNTGVMTSVSASAASRTSNVVTATVPSGHGLAAGDRVTTVFPDTTYNGGFTIASTPTATTVTWSQTAADDPSADAGTIARVFPYMAAFRRNGTILTAKAWKTTQTEPDWADDAYALSVDLDTLGTELERANIPNPDGSGESGIMHAHTALDTYDEWGALSIRQRQRTAA